LRKPSELASIRSRDLVLGLCVLTFAMLSIMSLLWHLRAEREYYEGSMYETWPAGPVLWTALSVMLVLGRRSLSRESLWQARRWLTAAILVWVLATALLGWFSLYLSGNVTGFPSEAHHAMLWTTITLGIAQLGVVTIVWEHMMETVLHRVTRMTTALWGGIVLGIGLIFGAYAIVLSFAPFSTS